MTLGSALAWQGRPGRGGGLDAAGRAHDQPGNRARLGHGRPVRPGPGRAGRAGFADALTAFRAAERLIASLPAPHPLAKPMRAWLVHALARGGDPGPAERLLSGLGPRDRDRGELRIAVAVLRLSQDDPAAPSASWPRSWTAPARVGWQSWLTEAFLLEALARDALGDPAAADAGPGAGPGPGRARRRAAVVPAAPRARPARTPHQPAHRPRRPGGRALDLLAGHDPRRRHRRRRCPRPPVCSSRSAAASSACCATCRPT